MFSFFLSFFFFFFFFLFFFFFFFFNYSVLITASEDRNYFAWQALRPRYQGPRSMPAALSQRGQFGAHAQRRGMIIHVLQV